MKKILKTLSALGVAGLALSSCGPKDNPPLVYFPDMYFPVAYDPLMKAEVAYSNKDNTIPTFVSHGGASAMYPAEGTVPRNKEGIVEANHAVALTPDQYNAGYELSKTEASPLQAATLEKDLAIGKIQYEKTCAACHGINGDGQGPIVQSGAYSGVPAYKDRQITTASVHYVLTYGRNAMGSYAGQLSQADRWRVATYVMQQFKGGLTAPAAATPTEPAGATGSGAAAPANGSADKTVAVNKASAK